MLQCMDAGYSDCNAIKLGALEGHCQLVGLRLRWHAVRAACSQLRRGGDAADLGPNLHGLGPGGSIPGGGHLMAAEQEEGVDPVMG